MSRSYDVAEWTARLFSKFAFEFADSPLLMHMWDWFVGEGQGYSSTLMSLKRHPDLRNLVVDILLQLARYNFVEIFTTSFKNAAPDPKDLMSFQSMFIAPLMANTTSRDEVLTRADVVLHVVLQIFLLLRLAAGACACACACASASARARATQVDGACACATQADGWRR